MGKFELTTQVRKDFVPDTVELRLGCAFMGESKAEIKDEFSASAKRVQNRILGMDSIDCRVTTTDLTFSDYQPQQEESQPQQKSKLFGGNKGGSKNYIVGAGDMLVKVSADKELNSNIMMELTNIVNSLDYVEKCGFNCYLSNTADKASSLREELTRKCKTEANEVVKGLGLKIKGVDSVLYNSGGSLMRGVRPSNTVVNDVDFATSNGSSVGDGDGDDKTLADNALIDALSKTTTLSDSLTMVYIVEMRDVYD